MKKRILSLALTLCLLAGLLPCLTMGAAAASRVDAAPYAGVEYTQNSGVKTGTVRYICQVPAYTDLFCPEYWGSYVGYANHECFTACISMALSYLGIDATPGALGDYWRSGGHYRPLPRRRRMLPSAARRIARPRSPRPSRATSAARAATARRLSTSTATRPTATMS